MKNKNIFTHKFLPILGLVFFILFILLINNSFAFTTSDYVKAFNSAKDYLKSNNIKYYDYVIFDYNNSIIICFLINENYSFSVWGNDENCYEYCNYYVIFNFGNSNVWDGGYPVVNNSSERYAHFPVNTIVYSSFDIKYSNGSVYFYKNELGYEFSFNLSNNEDSNSPLKVYSNFFSYEDVEKYISYISEDGFNWKIMNIYIQNDSENNFSNFYYYYYLTKNGTYYFKIIDNEINEEVFSTSKTITIINNNNNNNNNEIPIPYITYKKYGDFFHLRTQSFDSDNINRYTGYFVKLTDDVDINNIQWEEMSCGTYTNAMLNQTEYYYFIQVPADSEDCTYIFVFYDNVKKEFGCELNFTCNFESMNDYFNKVDESITTGNSNLDKLLNFFKQRFGFLTYPFEFIGNLLNRILNIEYGEPIIHIPELKIPNANMIIFNGFDYNFNTILENQAINNIYNIYLIAVDFIIVIGLVILAKNILMEVLGNG